MFFKKKTCYFKRKPKLVTIKGYSLFWTKVGFVRRVAVMLLRKPELFGSVSLEGENGAEKSRRDLIRLSVLFILCTPSTLQSAPNSAVMIHSPREATAAAETQRGVPRASGQHCR